MILYRPVGPQELRLIAESCWKRFPPRLPEQPIFYPVVQRDYAEKIAREWNVKQSGRGFVVQFQIDDAYLSQFQEQTAGGRSHTEYWIPAWSLEEFNNHIVGLIELIARFE